MRRIGNREDPCGRQLLDIVGVDLFPRALAVAGRVAVIAGPVSFRRDRALAVGAAIARQQVEFAVSGEQVALNWLSLVRVPDSVRPSSSCNISRVRLESRHTAAAAPATARLRRHRACDQTTQIGLERPHFFVVKVEARHPPVELARPHQLSHFLIGVGRHETQDSGRAIASARVGAMTDRAAVGECAGRPALPLTEESARGST